jgi:integrase/recombinase XerC
VPAQPLVTDPLLAAFLAERAQDSPHTRAAYARDLIALARHLEGRGLGPLAALTTPQLRAYVATRHRQGANPRSSARMLSAVRGFFSFLQRREVVAEDPTVGVQAPKAGRRLPRILDADLMRALLGPFEKAGAGIEEGRDPSAADGQPGAAVGPAGPAGTAPQAGAGQDRQEDRDSQGGQGQEGDGQAGGWGAWRAARDRAMLELLYSSGLRVSELMGLDLLGLDLAAGEVRVLGKGRKERAVPVGEAARQALADWLTWRAVHAPDGATALFLNARGGRLGVRQAQLMVGAAGRRQGIAQPVHPHMLRHACASHLLESSGDLRAVQEILGHERLGTTEIYTHLDFQRLATVYDAAHPRARRRPGGK